MANTLKRNDSQDWNDSLDDDELMAAAGGVTVETTKTGTKTSNITNYVKPDGSSAGQTSTVDDQTSSSTDVSW